MELLDHLLSALGRLLLWVSATLVLEEMTFAGLARLLLSRVDLRRARATRMQSSRRVRA